MRPPASSRTVPGRISFLAMATSSAGLSTMATSVMAGVAIYASLGLTICRRIYRPHHGIARLRRFGGQLARSSRGRITLVRERARLAYDRGHIRLPLGHTTKLTREEKP